MPKKKEKKVMSKINLTSEELEEIRWKLSALIAMLDLLHQGDMVLQENTISNLTYFMLEMVQEIKEEL